jgi:hypothetical protein
MFKRHQHMEAGRRNSTNPNHGLNDTLMDLFHAVTSGIEQVLTCHWFTDFKAFKMPETKLMDTERGGEQTQYVMRGCCLCIFEAADTINTDMRASKLRQSP